MTATTHRYPTHLIDIVRLANGARVTVRPTLPQDAELQRAFVRALSDRARYHRFLTELRELPPGLAEQFSDIDYQRHVALIAEFFVNGQETMIGEARYIIDDDDRTRCEFALAVADGWRALGLGHRLLRRLIAHAASSGIRRMTGDTLAANAAMVGLAEKIGFRTTQKPEDMRLVQLALDLAPPTSRVTAAKPGRWRRPYKARFARLDDEGVGAPAR